ncbi:MAG: retropepsin-like aspartic protease [Dehalococcoidia bacterium]
MGLIAKTIEVIGDKGKSNVVALFDTGAAGSFIRRDVAERIGTIVKSPFPRRFTLGDGKAAIEAREFLAVDMIVKDARLYHYLLVVDELSDEVILGADMLQRWKITLDPEKEDLFIDEKALRLRL